MSSLGGALAYGLVALQHADAVLPGVYFVGQALPLLSAPVRRHVQAGLMVKR